MKALTICQPYAHLIVTPEAELPTGVARKRVENRGWRCHYTGPLAIHAGKSRDCLTPEYRLRPEDMKFGAVVGLAVVVGCFSLEQIRRGVADQNYPWLRDHAHVEGEFCIVLANVVRLAHAVPCRGAQGLFDLPNAVAELVERQLGPADFF